MKTVCIYHSIDLDGWMSAAIVKHWFLTEQQKIVNSFKDHEIIKHDEIEFIGYNYGQPIPDLSGYDKVIMCDISFPRKEMFKLYENNDLIWLDHHISAINESKHSAVILSYDNSKGIRDTKFAACELTWLHFFPNEPMPEIVRLLGRYDCFGHKFTKEDEDRRLTLLEYTKSTTRIMSQEEQDELANLNIKLLEEEKVLEFQYGARSVISNYDEAYNWLTKCKSEIVLNNNPNYNIHIVFQNTNEIWNKGKAIYQYLCTEAKQIYKNGFEIKFAVMTENQMNEKDFDFIKGATYFKWKKFICINKERFNPINFGIDYHKDGYDGVACFWYNGNTKRWHFSLYNDNSLVDCSTIAKQFGGGGHKGASGFVLNNKEFNELINDYGTR